MVKFAVLFCLSATVILLALTNPRSPFGPGRDPVPPTQKVAHSSHCSGCHGVDEAGLAMVDKAGNDVSIFDDWQISMMGLSARDPFWRATMAHEVNLYPSAQQNIETTCLKCHAPLGSFEARNNGHTYSYAMMLNDSLGLDGVSCSACHQQSPNGLGSSFSGNYTIDTNRLMYGLYPNPFKGPMQIYVGIEPEYGEHIYTSELCASCHTLITETLNPDGTPSGEHFVEQATYHEWLNSSYAAQGKECQSCHMPFIEDGVIIATDFAALEERSPYGLHQFYGANTAMLELMRANKETLNLPVPEGSHAWDESIDNNRISLSNAAQLSVTSLYVADDTMYVSLTIRNKTGHKLPSGYPSRLAWLQVNLRDQLTGEVYYSNGALNDEGAIEGRDDPFEPHHEISRSEGDVQIYEMAMADLTGHLTTRLNGAHQPLKDNRLLPLGFKTDHSTYDTVAVWGSAKEDSDYTSLSANGIDRVEYHIPLDGRKGMADLTIALHYQALPSRWMADLFTNDTLSLVAGFKSMYQDYKQHNEIINQLDLDSLDLSTSSLSPIQAISVFNLSPNPVAGKTIYIHLEDNFPSTRQLNFQIIDLNGRIVQSGTWNEQIELRSDIQNGVYYLALLEQNRLLAVKPFTLL